VGAALIQCRHVSEHCFEVEDGRPGEWGPSSHRQSSFCWGLAPDRSVPISGALSPFLARDVFRTIGAGLVVVVAEAGEAALELGDNGGLREQAQEQPASHAEERPLGAIVPRRLAPALLYLLFCG